jgi:hypothetical protein
LAGEHFRITDLEYMFKMSSLMALTYFAIALQDMAPIMVHRGELERYTQKVASDLGIVWRSSHRRLRIMEVPPIRIAQEKEEKETTAFGGVEPFMQYIKEETGM